MPPKLRHEDEINQQAEEKFAPHPDLKKSELAESDLRAAEQAAGEEAGSDPYVNAGLDQAESHANDQQNSTGFINNFTGQKNEKVGFKGQVRRKGPIGVIVGVLGILGIAIPGFQAGAPFALISGLDNYSNSASRAADTRNNNMLRNMIGLIGNQRVCTERPNSMRCKLATVNEAMAKRYADKDFTLNTTKVGDRYIINSVTFPDGTVARNGNEFLAATRAKPNLGSLARSVHNPSAAILNSQLAHRVLAKIGLSKAPVRTDINRSDRESLARSFNTELRIADNTEAEAEAVRGRVSEGVKGIQAKRAAKGGGGVLTAGGVICEGYNAANATLMMGKAANASRFIGSFMLAARIIDAAKAGDGNSAQMAELNTILSRSPSSGPNKGKGAFDSPAIKAALHGDRVALDNETRKYTLTGVGAFGGLDDTLRSVNNTVGKENLRTGCQSVSNPLVGIAATTILCVAGGGTGGSVVPVLGTAVGAAAGAAICTGGNLIAGLVGGLIINQIIEYAAPKVVASLLEAPMDMSTVSGYDFGTAIGIGSGLLLARTNQANGLKLGTKDEVSRFLAATKPDYDQSTAIARYEAQKSPLDVTNQYSFAGQLSQKLSGAARLDGSAKSLSTTIGAIFTGAKRSFGSVAYGASMPSSVNPNTLDVCIADETLAAIDIPCDAVGVPQYVATSAELAIPVASAVDYMEQAQQINDDGTAKSGTNYEKFVRYCTGQGEGAFGEVILGIDDEDYDWPAKRCQENSPELSNFRAYVGYVQAKDNEDTVGFDPSTLAQEQTVSQGDTSVVPSKDGWGWPAKTGTITGCWRKPGHTGIDIGVPTGTDVYAIKDGEVVQAGPGGDAGNYIMIKHADGLWSNYQHNSQLLVSKGESVRQGQLIAKSGNTGFSTGPHIHFGVTSSETLSSRKSGTDSVNVALYLPQEAPGITGTAQCF